MMNNKPAQTVEYGATVNMDLPPLRDLSDEELVTAHLNGRIGAFRELHDRFHGRLRNFIRGKTGRSERVQDLLQDTWLRVARHLRRFDPAKRFSTWVFTIAANLCKNELRNRSRSRMIPFGEVEARRRVRDLGPFEIEDTRRAPDRLYQEREARNLVEQTLKTLSPDHEKVFRLREIRGKSYKAVADQLGVHLGTVKSRLHRARKDFEKKLPSMT